MNRREQLYIWIGLALFALLTVLVFGIAVA